jgi:UDP-GlcNAc:undecaprenyl-phosphate GlcNAc-1-phosphate transferase
MMIEIVAVFAVAFLVSAVLVPPIQRTAVLRKLLDFPDDDRRAHKRPVPRLGGVAVFGGFVIAIATSVLYQWKMNAIEPGSIQHIVQLLLACALLFAVGLADDLRGVPPIVKLAAQTTAALIIQYHWTLLDTITFPPNVTISLGWLGVPLMVLWLVGMSNALNLVDGLDGLAGGVSLIALCTFVACTFLLGTGAMPVSSAALAGAMLGFLVYNFPPASIFLGDSGSLVVGFLLAFFAVRRSTGADGSVLAIIPLFALAYPLLDTGVSMLRRWLRGHPLSRADGRHIHHQLIGVGLSARKAVAVIYCFSIGVAVLGLSVTFAPPAFTIALMATGAVLIVAVVAYSVQWLQYHEFIDAGLILGSAGRLAKRAIRDSIQARDVSKLIANASSLSQIDAILGTQAATFGFAHMQAGPCDARMPYDLEPGTKSLWKLEYPVVVPTTGGFRTTGELEESLVLAIWCAKDSKVRSASAERVAHVLAAAIAQWSLSVSDSVGKEIRVRAKTPHWSYSPVSGVRIVRDTVATTTTAPRRAAGRRASS